MRRLILLPVVLLLVLLTASVSRAEPAWGGNCLGCHSDLQTDTLVVFGEDTTADPDESETGAPDRGTLKVFEVDPGDTKTLQAMLSGLVADDTYAVELKRFRFPGVEGNGELTYMGDCDWPEWGESANYYSEPVIGYRWGADPTVFTFDIDVGADAPADYYDLVFAVAGKLADDAGLFYAEEHFYLRVLPVPGDCDGDGDVDLSDFFVFQTCFTGPGGQAPPNCECVDLDGDGDVDLADFLAFQTSFTGPGT